MNIIASKHFSQESGKVLQKYPHIQFMKVRCEAEETPGLESMKRKSKENKGCYDQFVVTKSFYFFDTKHRIEPIIVPKGFITDFASVPQFLWSVIPAHGLGTNPSIVHDYLYVYAVGTRKDADDIFRELLLKEGMSKMQAYLMWKAVRVFGASRFDRTERAKEAVIDNLENLID